MLSFGCFAEVSEKNHDEKLSRFLYKRIILRNSNTVKRYGFSAMKMIRVHFISGDLLLSTPTVCYLDDHV
jgi:hypothetical protein